MQLVKLEHVSDELVDLLKNNYVESENYILQYDKNFLEWALFGKNKYIIQLSIDNKLIGCVTAAMRSVLYDNINKDVAIVNFLCVHKDYRNKSINNYPIASILKQELFKYIAHDNFSTYGIFTIAYKPNSKTQTNTSIQHFYYINNLNYFHRPININKLLDNDYISVIHNKDITKKIYKINKKTDLIPMSENHMKMVMHLLNNSKFTLKYNYTKKDIKQLFLDSKPCKSFVKLVDNKVVDFVSIYILPSKIKSNSKLLNIAYIYTSTLDNYDNLLPILKNMKIDELKCLTYKKPYSYNKLKNTWLTGQKLDFYSFSKKIIADKDGIGITLV